MTKFSSRWLGLWSENVGNLIVLFAGIFAVMEKDNITPGLAGLSISYALEVSILDPYLTNNAFRFVLRTAGKLTVQINAKLFASFSRFTLPDSSKELFTYLSK